MPDINWALLSFVVVVSMVSGLGSFLQQRRSGRTNQTGWGVELLTELMAALTAGLGALFLGLWQEYPFHLICLIALIAASNGQAFIELGRNLLTKRFNGGNHDN